MIIKITENNQIWLSKETGLVFFLSLDIENSTKYKISNPNNWMFHFTSFFSAVRWHFENQNRISNSLIFKENGDETIISFFPLNLNNLKEILDISIKSIETITDYRKVLKDIGLDYKATLFCAGFHEPKPFSIYDNNENRSDQEHYDKYFNIDFKNHRMHRTISRPNGDFIGQPSSCIIGSIKEYDYIGPDIDIGFRISKYSEPNKLVVSDKVAYIYSNLFSDTYLFKVTKSEKLKGVWNNSLYPIIEFSNDKIDSINFDTIYNEIKSLVNPENFLNKVKEDLSV